MLTRRRAAGVGPGVCGRAGRGSRVAGTPVSRAPRRIRWHRAAGPCSESHTGHSSAAHPWASACRGGCTRLHRGSIPSNNSSARGVCNLTLCIFASPSFSCPVSGGESCPESVACRSFRGTGKPCERPIGVRRSGIRRASSYLQPAPAGVDEFPSTFRASYPRT